MVRGRCDQERHGQERGRAHRDAGDEADDEIGEALALARVAVILIDDVMHQMRRGLSHHRREENGCREAGYARRAGANDAQTAGRECASKCGNQNEQADHTCRLEGVTGAIARVVGHRRAGDVDGAVGLDRGYRGQEEQHGQNHTEAPSHARIITSRRRTIAGNTGRPEPPG